MKTKKFKVVMSILVISTLAFSIAGCGQSNISKNEQAVQKTQSTSQAVETKAEKSGPLDKYEPEISMISALSYFDSTKFLNNDTADSNLIVETIKNELGINISYKVAAPQAQYQDKINVAIASADIPDVFQVTKDQYAKLLKTNLLADDLTSAVNDYSSDILKSILASDDGMGMKVATVKGKLKAIPYVGNSLSRAEVLYLRNDWLKKLGLDVPKTMDDLVKVLDAFVNKDPDSNGKNDTVGLVASKALFLDFASLQGIFSAYDAFPKIWIEKDGKLQYGSFQPEMKRALLKLQEMYKAGLIDKEFAVKDFGKAAEAVINGKAGAFIGNITLPIWPCGFNVAKDANAQWGYYPVVSGDAQEPKIVQPNAISNLYVVRKGYEHPEAVIKIMNLMLEKLFGKTAEFDKYYGIPGKTSSNSHLNPFKNYNAKKDYNAYLAVKKAIAVGSSVGLDSEQKSYYDNSLAWVNKKELGTNGFNFGINGVFNTPSSFDVVDGYVKGNRLIDDAFYGAPTSTMTSKLSTIDKMIDEAVTKIIMGDTAVDEFDKVVKDAMELGGQQMTDEVNQWIKDVK